jgi:MEDS: MEthanogen/methylotroph, DcmR Sensory domain
VSEGAPEASKLGDVLKRVCLHDHLCLIYEDPQERLTAPILSIRMGLERGEKCFYIPDDSIRSDVVAALRHGGVDIEAATESGRLTIAGVRETYLRDGYFQPDRMIRFFSETLNTTTAGSFSGLKVVCEMTWALDSRAGTERLMEYEATLNNFVRDHSAVVTCQYDRTRFPPEVVLNAIRTHPVVVCGKLVCSNRYYVPPEDFLSPTHPEMEVERLLSNILEREPKPNCAA